MDRLPDTRTLLNETKSFLSEAKKIVAITHNKRKHNFTNDDLQEMLDDMGTYWDADNLPSWLYKTYILGDNRRDFPKNKKATIELLEKMIKHKGTVEINTDWENSFPYIRFK